MNLETGEITYLNDAGENDKELMKKMVEITGLAEIAEAVGIIEKAKETGETPTVDLNGDSKLAAWAREERVKAARHKTPERKNARKRTELSRRKNRG